MLEAHEGEKVVLDASVDHGRMYGFVFEPSPSISSYLKEGEQITFGNSQLAILYTPGHSPASITFYSKEDGLAIVGDVLFFMSIGRSDLPGGDHAILLRSIREQLFTLPDETLVYNGHGQQTSIGFEKQNNPFFQY